VIVGAGAAGSVVASRLSESEDVSVLVLEAGGPDDDSRIARPSAYRELVGSDLDWKFATEEEPHLANRRIPWPRGRVWGGSGTISAMVYVRGPARDFDRWRELGNAGWGFEDLLPFFRKAENQERGPSVHHGTGGPQNVADARWVPRSAAPSSRPRARSACRGTRTGTGRARRARASSSSTRGTASGTARPPRTCAPRSREAT